jgi:hypothetical protein
MCASGSTGLYARGQILGAVIGPGSSQLILEAGRVAPWGRVGITLLRTVHNKYYVFRNDETNIQLGLIARYRWP